MFRRVAVATVNVALVASVGAVAAVTSASSAAASSGALVSAVPAATTPNVGDGASYSVHTIVQIGSTIIQGGLFSVVSAPGTTSPSVSRKDIYAANASTGAVSSNFVPKLDGSVDAMVPGPVSGTVLIGGSFTHVDGVAAKGVALLNVGNGSLLSGFRSPAMNGNVNSMALTHGELLLAGTFTSLGGVAHAGLGSVSPTTGAVDSYVRIQLAGHHNYGVNCTAGASNCTFGPVGATKLAVSPDGGQLMVIGNFTSAGGLARDQVARILLGSASATVDANWQTARYHPACYSFAYDSYVRDVAYSPDGSYFVIVATGGGGKPSPKTSGCDAAARFESAASGSNVQPTWMDFAGNDTLFSVAVASGAIYVGGHQRWLNNANGSDSAGAGAVPRPGIAALDPANGLPFSWNPGRNPRGARVDVLYLTPAGLWAGGDTDYIGNRHYYRGKDSFFPYAGGKTLPASATTSLPANVYLAGRAGGSSPDVVTQRYYDGSSAGTTSTIASSAPWGTARGGFMVDGRLIYGQSDGNLYARTFTGGSFGAPALLDPYDDPAWDNVQTGSGQTYRGAKSPFYPELPNVTGMTYANGYLFYTLSGNTHLFYRYFTAESGITGATEFVAGGSVNLSTAEGLFISGGNLYWADKTTGFLNKAGFLAPRTPGGKATGAALAGPVTVANTTNDWRSRALFLGPS